jgi:hypothetical protein
MSVFFSAVTDLHEWRLSYESFLSMNYVSFYNLVRTGNRTLPWTVRLSHCACPLSRERVLIPGQPTRCVGNVLSEALSGNGLLWFSGSHVTIYLFITKNRYSPGDLLLFRLLYYLVLNKDKTSKFTPTLQFTAFHLHKLLRHSSVSFSYIFKIYLAELNLWYYFFVLSGRLNKWSVLP